MVKARRAALFVGTTIIFAAVLALPPGHHVRANEHHDSSGRNDDRGRASDKGGRHRHHRCDPLRDQHGTAKRIDGRCPTGGSSNGIAKGDFNGDGFADLAIGVPGEETPSGVPSSGAVIVIYGSASGLTATDPNVPASQFWSQNATGVPGTSEAGDGFGSALAAGDFNDDGFSDLAIGAPADVSVRGGAGFVGQVYVIYGSSVGLTTDNSLGVPRAQRFSMGELNTGGLLAPFAATTEDDVPGTFSFGAALAWGDFNGDGFGDLAVGSPREVVEDFESLPRMAGAVGIIFGSSTGLEVAGSQVFTQESPGILGNSIGGDLFGAALAGGDFDGDGVTDLAIGIPLKSVPGTATQGGGLLNDAGKVLVLFGSSGVGLVTTLSRSFDETDLFEGAVFGAGDRSQAGARFGSALAAGDFNGDGRDDLAAAAPFKTIRGLPQAGGVWVVFGAINTASGTNQFWEQSLIFPGSTAINERDGDGSPTEAGDLFGAALAAGDFNGDGRDDLAIGAPFEDVLVQRSANSFGTVVDAGAVTVVYGSATGLSIAGRAPQLWHQQSINIEEEAEAGDRFGSSLTAWNFGRNETRQVCTPVCFRVPVLTADLAIGVPFEDVGSVVNAGAVNVIYGSFSANGLTFSSDQVWTQNSPGVPGASQTNDRFGGAVY
jgi:hypothetical protein